MFRKRCYTGWEAYDSDSEKCVGAPCGGDAYQCSVPCHRYGVASGVMDVYCFTCAANDDSCEQDYEAATDKQSVTKTWTTLGTKSGSTGICASGTVQLQCSGTEIYVHPRAPYDANDQKTWPRCEAVSCQNDVFDDGGCPAWAPCDADSSLCKSYIDLSSTEEDYSS